MSSTQPLYEEPQRTYSRGRKKLIVVAIVETIGAVILLVMCLFPPYSSVSNLFLFVLWVPLSAYCWLAIRKRQRFRVFADSLEPAIKPLSYALNHLTFKIRADEVEQVWIEPPYYNGTWPKSITLRLRSGKEMALGWPGKDAYAPVRGFVDRLVATGMARLAAPRKI
jgi:hypothetical protein